MADKLSGWLILVIALSLTALVPALIYGLPDLLFDGPKEGLKTIFGTCVTVVIVLVLHLIWGSYKDKRNQKIKKNK
ncbi:hypothetical protein KRX56_01725 [Dermabacteraceae bacterium TAE3-ERU27]|nr:hypothetical protein [Dermabacteraceae bacterium TAE3-ERU27]